MSKRTGHRFSLFLLPAVFALACGGGSAGSGAGDPAGGSATEPAEPADPHAEYAPLEVGAGYQSWQKVNIEPFRSPTHGGRFVDVYVNEIGIDAYFDKSAEVPVGTVIVKPSWEAEDGAPTEVAGPTFVMEKKEAGFDPDNHDWWYALHWEEVPPSWQERMDGAEQVYWRTPSAKVGYCSGCHESEKKYPRQLGGVPDDKRVESP